MQRHRRRLSSVTLAVLVWLGLGLTLPLVFSSYSPDLGLRGVVAAPRDSFTIDRPIELGQAPQVMIDRGTIVLVNTSGKESSGEPIATMLARGDAGLVLEGATILVGPNQWAVPNTDGPVAPLVEVVKSQSWETLAIRRSAIVVTLPGGQVESLTDVQADVSLKRKGAVAVKGSGLLRGYRVSFQATAGTQVDRKGPPSLPLKLQIESPLLKASFDGKLGVGDSLEMHGQSEVAIERVRQAARWFGALWPPGGPGLAQFAAKGQFDWTGSALDFDQATFRMDGNAATGVLGLSLQGSRPTVTGTLAFDTLNLSPYLPGVGGPEDKSAGIMPTWATLTSGLLDFPLDTVLGLDVRISAERVTAGNVELGRAAATIALKEGRLIADLAELEFVGGKGNGQIRADLSGYYPKVALRLKLDDVDLGRVSSVLAGRAVLQGPASVVADVSASGVTAFDLIRSLGGRVSIKAQQSGKVGIDLKNMPTAVPAGEIEGWAVALRGATSFDQLDLRLVVREGVVLSETAELVAGDAAWNATGLVSLPAGRMDIRLTQGAKLGPARPPAEAAKSRTLELRGPWMRPQVRIVPETSDAAGTGDWVPTPPASWPDRG